MGAVYAFVRQGFRQAATYALFNWMGLIGNFTWMLLFVAIWNALLADDPVARAQMLSYVFITRLLDEWLWVERWELSQRFEKGDVALELIKPLPFPLRLAADWFGRGVFRVVRALPAFALVGWLVGVRLPDLVQLPLFLVSSVLGWIISCCLWTGFSLVALWTTKFDHFDHLLEQGIHLFSGSFLPFWYLPAAVGAIAPFTPFAGIHFTPAAIFTGALTGMAALEAMALQAFWAAALTALVTLQWQAGGRRLVVQGG